MLVFTFSAKAFNDSELCNECLAGGNTTVADVMLTTSKIKYYKTKQYSTIKKTGFTTSTEKTKKY